mmetsp:Transcript_25125/g.78223  ORF Transcript_25125/g.78223 Transcript_25125/m.78223 type:complete len:425 (-) Transcript_25125:101-1375(-)
MAGPEKNFQNSLRLDSPVTVTFVANFISVRNVDTVQQFFEAEVAIRGRTAGLAALGGTSDNWEPRISVLNLINTLTWKYRAKLAADGELDMKWTIIGTFAEAFELHNFPRDRQDLSLRISTSIPRFAFGPAAPPEDSLAERKAILDRLDELTQAESDLAEVRHRSKVELDKLSSKVIAESRWLHEQISTRVLRDILSFKPQVPNQSVVQASNFCMASTYDLSSAVRIHESRTYARNSSTRQVRPLLVVSLSISRHASYFFWNIELPMAMITLFAAGTFLCERDASDRLGLSLTLVLTAVAFKFILAADLPKISYLTSLDAFVLFNFFGIGLVVFENSICQTWVMDIPILEEHHLDRFFLYVWLALYVLYMVYYFISAAMQFRSRRAEESRHEMLVSKVREPQPRAVTSSDDQRSPLLLQESGRT